MDSGAPSSPMERHPSDARDDGPTQPRGASEAVATLDAAAPPRAPGAPRSPDASRRCFICLTDQDAADPPGSWVDPCPCTLEAHQDCMLSWVTDCERSNKPLQCPVCKSPIELEGPWDLVVAAADAVHARFTRASPYVLFTGLSMGVQFSLQMYGALAFWAFAGKHSLMRFLLGPAMVVDGRSAAGMAFAKERLWNALVMMNVAPALLFGRLLPSLSNKVFVPVASVYGVYHFLHEDDFVSWPPSPQLAMAVFPYVRSIYYHVWKELVLPYEIRLNRQLTGLPMAEEQPVERQPAAADDGQDGPRDVEGGVIGLLQGVLDALDPDDDDDGPGPGPGGQHMARAIDHIEIVHEEGEFEGGGPGDVMVQLEIEEVEANDNDNVVAVAPQPPNGVDAGQGGHQGGHEAPQAPPRRLGIGGILSNVSNSIVSALILPGISLAMGEALRLVLPRAWTAQAPRNPWGRYGPGGRPGLLQQQWGCSLVGGCLYIVLNDAVRLYAKSRRVAAMDRRRVKNVDRPRRRR